MAANPEVDRYVRESQDNPPQIAIPTHTALRIAEGHPMTVRIKDTGQDVVVRLATVEEMTQQIADAQAGDPDGPGMPAAFLIAEMVRPFRT
jgi:hypothetical protein